MGRPKKPYVPKMQKCISCGKEFEQQPRRRRKTCSDPCYKETRNGLFSEENIEGFRRANRERQEYLKSNYEEPLYNVTRV